MPDSAAELATLQTALLNALTLAFSYDEFVKFLKDNQIVDAETLTRLQNNRATLRLKYVNHVTRQFADTLFQSMIPHLIGVL